MADGFAINIQGAELLEKKLLALERKVAKKIVRKAVRAGAKPLLKATKAAAQSMVGGAMGQMLSKNIVTRAFKKQKKGQYGVGVSTKSESAGAPVEFVAVSQSGDRQYIPAAIEFGHVDRGGGWVPAIPFMRSSFDATKRASEKIVAQTLKTEIECAAK